MNEEIQEVVQVDKADLQTLQDGIQTLIESNSVDIEGELKTTPQLLKELLEVMTPDEEVQLQELQQLETEEELLVALNENIIGLNTTLQNNHEIVLQRMDSQNELNVEGYFFISLTVVISIAVYMFYNQLSKW